MTTVAWDPAADASEQLGRWCRAASKPGVVRARFPDATDGGAVGWSDLEPWTRSRAVTIVEIASSLAGAARDVALCADLVYLHQEAMVVVEPDAAPTEGLLWALGRAGRAALARGLLDPGPIAAEAAVRLGLAQGIVTGAPDDRPIAGASLAALTNARDLMRVSLRARPSLERAAFRLLFASGHPGEGARAFFDRRLPVFDR